MIPSRSFWLATTLWFRPVARTYASPAGPLNSIMRASAPSGSSGQRIWMPPSGMAQSSGRTMRTRSAPVSTDAPDSTTSSTLRPPPSLPRLHAGPQPAEAAHGEGMHAKVENVLHAGGKEPRQSACHERMVALVRQRAALGHMVVASHGDHATQRRGAGQVGVLERIAAAIHARSLAVPDAEHAVVLLAGRIELQLLRPPHGGDAEFLI